MHLTVETIETPERMLLVEPIIPRLELFKLDFAV